MKILHEPKATVGKSPRSEFDHTRCASLFM